MKKILALILAIAFMFCGGYAYAGTATSQSTVTINYTGGCSISSDNLELNYDETSGATGSLAVKVTCSNGLDWAVTANSGLNSTGETRRAKKDTDYIVYRFFKDGSYTQEITVTTNAVASGTGNGSEQSNTVYAKINTADNSGVKTGTYTDTVTFTVTF